MTRLIDWIEQAAIRLARRLAPPDRAGWLAAMVAELDHITPEHRTRFVTGCVVAALRMRAGSPGFVLLAARCLLVAGSGGWALLNIRFAGLPVVDAAPSMQAFAYTAAAVFAAGGLATARSGVGTTIALAGPLVLLGGTVALVLKLALPPSPASHLLLALLVEHLAILMVALAAAFTAQAFSYANGEVVR